MKSTIRKTISFLGVALVATQLNGATKPDTVRTLGSSAAYEQAMPATPAQKEVEKLLKQISLNAAIASRHADRLESFTRGIRLQHRTHADELNGVKEAINDMGADL